MTLTQAFDKVQRLGYQVISWSTLGLQLADPCGGTSFYYRKSGKIVYRSITGRMKSYRP